MSYWKEEFAKKEGTVYIKYFNTREQFGSLDERKDQEWPGITTVDGGTILSQIGQSYSQWVDLNQVDDVRKIRPVGLIAMHHGSEVASSEDSSSSTHSSISFLLSFNPRSAFTVSSARLHRLQ